MGVLNVTPDSFSGDGLYGLPEAVADRARWLEAEGADLLDIGGESTRPGSLPVSLDEELARVLPAVEAVVGGTSIPLSVDTSKSEVARRVLAVGATVVNDVSCLRDPAMLSVVAQAGAGLVLVHHGPARCGGDIIMTVRADLRRLIARAEGAGVSPSAIAVDPGLGMGKNWLANFEILRRLGELRELGKPILVGPSRKGMIGRVLGAGPQDRVEGTVALVSLCVANGADMVRVHDVKEMARAARMIDAIVRAL